MKPTLKFTKPYIENNVDHYGKKCRLCCDVYRNNIPFKLFYEFEHKYTDILYTETIDPFFVALFPYALESGYNLESEHPVSSAIYYQLCDIYMPAVCSYQNYFSPVHIDVEQSDDDIYTPGTGVATGVSCGVDSIYTILKHTRSNNPHLTKKFDLTHLVIMNAGSCGFEGGDISWKWFSEEVKAAEKISTELNLELITIHTNLMEFYECNHAHSGTLRMAGCMLALQKEISTYFLASGYEISKFAFDEDDAKYAFFTLQCASTRNLRFYLSGTAESRDMRVRYISDSIIAKNNLNVCWYGYPNCSRCEKCLRTMGSLYSINKLAEYKNVFDIEDFEKNKTYRIAQMMGFRLTHPTLYDFLKIIKNKEPLLYLKAKLIYLLRIAPVEYAMMAVKKIVPKDSSIYKLLKSIAYKIFKGIRK